MYAKIESGTVMAYPYGPAELRRDFPNTSFPMPMSDADLAAYDVLPVIPCDPPAHDPVAENCVRVDPTLQDGQWTETWLVSPASAGEIAQRTDERASQIRAERNRLLADCDWTMLQDAPVNQEPWATYRQQLRDIPNQAGFPVSVIWPTPPA